MGALSFWYFWPIGIRKKWINFIFKKRKNFWGGSNWPVFSFTFWGVPTLSSIFSVISWSILKILVPILVQISWILWNTPSFLNFDVFEWSYGRNKENLQFRKLANLSHPWKSSFFEDEIYPLFSYSYGSNIPKWKCAHNLLCKKYKNCSKLIKIAVLQPPDWIQRKKNTL